MTLLTADSLKPLVANEIPASQVKDCRLLWFARIGPVNLASDCTEMNLWFSAVKFNSLLVARAIPLICGSYLAVQDQTCVSAHTTKRKPHTATPKTDTESAATMWSENIPSNVSRTAGQRAKLSGFPTLHGWSWTCVLKDKNAFQFPFGSRVLFGTKGPRQVKDTHGCLVDCSCLVHCSRQTGAQVRGCVLCGLIILKFGLGSKIPSRDLVESVDFHF